MPSSKIVLITGCSEGSLGSALALAFQAQGLQVIATARSQTKLDHLNGQPNIQTMLLDVCDIQSIRSCASSLQRLDILVNNAGGLYASPLSDADLIAAKKLFDLNVWAQLAITQELLPLLVKTKGIIVNQTNISSVTNVPWNRIYNSSKAAMAIMSDTLRLELEPFGVRVVELKTGAVKSGFYQNRNSNHNTVSTTALPKTSLYHKASAAVEKSMNGDDVQAEAMSAQTWAKQVVDEVMNDPPTARVWKGKNAFAVWFARRFMPHDFLDGNMRKMGQFDDVKRAVS